MLKTQFPKTLTSHNERFSGRFLFMFVCCAHFSCSETSTRPAQQHFSPRGTEKFATTENRGGAVGFLTAGIFMQLWQPGFIYFFSLLRIDVYVRDVFDKKNTFSQKCNYHHCCQSHVGLTPNNIRWRHWLYKEMAAASTGKNKANTEVPKNWIILFGQQCWLQKG